MLPVLISQMVVVLKDTAIGYQITFVEMVRQGTKVGSSYGNYIPGTDRHRAADDHRELRAVVVRGLAGAADAASRSVAPAPLDAGAVEQEGAPGARSCDHAHHDAITMPERAEA